MITITEVPIESFEKCIPANQESFYRCVQLVIDAAGVRELHPDIKYDDYVSALIEFEDTTLDMADEIWSRQAFDWAPDVVQQSIKQGIRSGFAWAKKELSNG